ncbi:hypothetical protein QNI16_05625 [Cytophagaceae bacterium YF14B1]|uniref:Uncharacterized protein n=1 Tax=Xanthocytophaga flava TaxID=3048013 RepID=A0AAE3U5W7_9BACT|nr:hypothetical protein [Xanthocytophaga flavus]MDJ1479957.1 hypothetical protein [Xanthocytophaga flavus]
MKHLKYILLLIVVLFETYFIGIGSTLLKDIPQCDEGILMLFRYDCIISVFHGLQPIWQEQIVSMLHVDFIFILVYTFLLLLWSYLEMQQQRSVWLNELLRLNILLGILAAVADCIENMILLHDFSIPVRTIYQPDVFSFIKWGCIGWIVVVLLMSRVPRFFA